MRIIHTINIDNRTVVIKQDEDRYIFVFLFKTFPLEVEGTAYDVDKFLRNHTRLAVTRPLESVNRFFRDRPVEITCVTCKRVVEIKNRGPVPRHCVQHRPGLTVAQRKNDNQRKSVA